MQFTSNKLDVIDWERAISVADSGITWHCRLIGGSARETIFRVDSISVADIITIEIGGGPWSYVKVPWQFCSEVSVADIEDPLKVISARILASDKRLHFEFPEEIPNLKWWAEQEADDDDEDEEGFRW